MKERCDNSPVIIRFPGRWTCQSLWIISHHASSEVFQGVIDLGWINLSLLKFYSPSADVMGRISMSALQDKNDIELETQL